MFLRKPRGQPTISIFPSFFKKHSPDNYKIFQTTAVKNITVNAYLNYLNFFPVFQRLRKSGVVCVFQLAACRNALSGARNFHAERFDKTGEVHCRCLPLYRRVSGDNHFLDRSVETSHQRLYMQVVGTDVFDRV